MLSVVIPAYNESENIHIAAETISSILEDNHITYELIFIDDGSKDDTFKQIMIESKKTLQKVRGGTLEGIQFSRNFGKEKAIMAGLKFASGDCCAVIDCDLQHPPEHLVDMYRKWEEGYHVVEGVKSSRGSEGFLNSVFAKIFYKVLTYFTRFDLSESSDFKLIDRKVVNEIVKMPENNQFFRAITFWVGFDSTQVEYNVNPRKNGETKWGYCSLIKYAISNIATFTSAPLHIVTIIGIFFLIFSAILAIHTLYKYMIGESAEGFATVILLLLIIGGLLMISLGIIGFYIAKIYEEVKRRPPYIIKQSTKDIRDIQENR